MRWALALLAVLVAGCAARVALVPFETVSRQPAVLRWQTAGKTSLHEALCERSQSGAVRVTIEPGGRQFLLEANGFFAARGWTGPSGEAPLNLVIWASFLTIYQNAERIPVGDRELHTPAGRIAVNKTASGIQSLSILNVDTAETLSVVFRKAN